MHEFTEEAREAGRDARHDQPGVAVEDLQRLWAPWRSGYITGGDPVEGCPFCVLPARDPSRDEESLILHRGERVFVVLNAYPYNPGHLMVVPYEHTAEVEALDEDTAQELWRLGRRSVSILKEHLSCQGVNLGMNVGAAGGAGIADHLHLHAVPRWAGDTNFMSTVAATRVLSRALEAMWSELAPAFAERSR